MMNDYLKNVLEQPKELKKVLETLIKEDYLRVKEIANLLTVSEEIVLTSMGSAYNSLMPMYYALMKQGKKVTLIETSELLQNPEWVKKNKLYIMMSRSGESREVFDLSVLLKEKSCLLIGITMTPDSTLGKNADILLNDCSTYDKCICLKAYTSLALCGLFCVSQMNGNRMKKDEEKELFRMFQWMEENKGNILVEIEKIPFFSQAHSYIFLSRGYGMGVAKAASLWLEEIAFVGGDIMSIENFYHGPIRSVLNSELADNIILPVYIDVLPTERTDMIWREIVSTSKGSVYFGKKGSVTERNSCIIYPEFQISDEYLMILLAMYVQLFAYQCCIVKGYKPGISLGIPKDRWVVK